MTSLLAVELHADRHSEERLGPETRCGSSEFTRTDLHLRARSLRFKSSAESAESAPMTTRTGGTARASVLLARALSLVALSYRHVLTAGFVRNDHPRIDERVLSHEIRRLSRYLAHSRFDGLRAFRFDDAVASINRALGLIPGVLIAAQLRRKVVETQSRWQALPRKAPDDDRETTAERAPVTAHKERIRNAAALWIRVIEHPEASPRRVQRAAFHFSNGDCRLEGARHFFERRLATGADPVPGARLEHVLDDRRLRP